MGATWAGALHVLFNSYLFLFVFFPVALSLYLFAGRWGEGARLVTILVASAVFYAAWDVRFLALLGGSILANFMVGRFLIQAVEDDQVRRTRLLLGLGVAANLLTLGIFKYANFFIANVNALSGSDIVLGHIVLPLGISFFTFEQIGYLVDIRRGFHYRADLLRYAVFVSFFPRLVAGPILRYGEIAPQLESGAQTRSRSEDIAVGLTIFVIGLAKKAALADGIAPYVAPVFGSAAHGVPVDLFVAWAGALAYTCQLYFDFSGYSDMAIGAARCFGIRFPMNFNSPYKSSSIIEFWRRWHMTLSRFLRDYLYISLGGNRRGPVRRYANLVLTMLLGGLWHGANWTFVAWGGLHGLYLVINHGWHALRRSLSAAEHRPSAAGRIIGVVLTFLAVVVAWIFFRAPTFAAAIDILAGMVGLHGATIPAALASRFAPAWPVLHALGVTVASGDGAKTVEVWCWIFGLMAIAFFGPNTQEIMSRFEPVLEMSSHGAGGPRLAWRPSLRWAIAGGAVAFLGIISITRVSEFLYWQF